MICDDLRVRTTMSVLTGGRPAGYSAVEEQLWGLTSLHSVLTTTPSLTPGLSWNHNNTELTPQSVFSQSQAQLRQLPEISPSLTLAKLAYEVRRVHRSDIL